MKRAAEKAKGNDLFQMLQDKEVQEKEARIQQMIDQELDKPDDQVDFERIEACVKALHTLHEQPLPVERNKPLLPQQSRKSSRLWKVGMASCVAALLLLLSILSSVAFDVGIMDKFLEWSKDGWIFHPPGQSEEESRPEREETAVLQDLRRQLEEKGFESLLLPHYKQETLRVEQALVDDGTGWRLAELTFIADGIRIYQWTRWYDDPSKLTEYRYENDYDGVEAIEIDGRRYYLLHTDDRTRVLTVYGNALYDISFHCGPEITKEILFTYY